MCTDSEAIEDFISPRALASIPRVLSTQVRRRIETSIGYPPEPAYEGLVFGEISFTSLDLMQEPAS
jgi:hypothetical protein